MQRTRMVLFAAILPVSIIVLVVLNGCAPFVNRAQGTQGLSRNQIVVLECETGVFADVMAREELIGRCNNDTRAKEVLYFLPGTYDIIVRYAMFGVSSTEDIKLSFTGLPGHTYRVHSGRKNPFMSPVVWQPHITDITK